MDRGVRFKDPVEQIDDSVVIGTLNGSPSDIGKHISIGDE